MDQMAMAQVALDQMGLDQVVTNTGRNNTRDGKMLPLLWKVKCSCDFVILVMFRELHVNCDEKNKHSNWGLLTQVLKTKTQMLRNRSWSWTWLIRSRSCSWTWKGWTRLQCCNSHHPQTMVVLSTSCQGTVKNFKTYMPQVTLSLIALAVVDLKWGLCVLCVLKSVDPAELFTAPTYFLLDFHGTWTKWY